jgi:hypothetical protein
MDFIISIIRIAAEVLFLALFVPFCFFVLTLSRALSKCSRTSRTIEPGAVWLMLLPLFNLIWQFVVVTGLAKSMGSEFRARGVSGLEPTPGKSIGIAMCVCAVCGLVPVVNFIALPVCLILFLIYWSKIAGFSHILDRVPARDSAALYVPQNLPPVMPPVLPVAGRGQPTPYPAVPSADGPPIHAVSQSIAVGNAHQLPVALRRFAPSLRGLESLRKLNLKTRAGVLLAIVALGVLVIVWRVMPHPGHAGAYRNVAQMNRAMAYLKGDGVPRSFEKGAQLLEPLADDGDPEAQYYLGRLYEDGTGVPKSNETAIKWIRRGAGGGNTDAQAYLGALYFQGKIVQQSYEESAKWFKLAAINGDVDAQYFIGSLYDAGIGVPRSDEEAVKWYRHAADQGNASAQNAMGVHYARGTGVPMSREEAINWWRRSANGGDETAKMNLRNQADTDDVNLMLDDIGALPQK